MRRALAVLNPRDRVAFFRSAALLAGASAAIVAIGYGIAMPLDSMVVLMIAVIAGGTLFTLGGMALIWFRFRAMGYPPFPSTIAYLAAVYFAANLLTTRAFEAKLMAVPFVIGLLLPFVVTGRGEGKKNHPPVAGDDENVSR